MKLVQEQLKKLKGKANSLEELREYAKSVGLECSEEDLNDVYNQLQDEDLENISGGSSFTQGKKIIADCRNCHKRMKLDPDGSSSRCSHCGTWNNKDNAYYGC